MFDHILLEPDQEDLLGRLVEAARSVDRGARRPFHAVSTLGHALAVVMHPGFARGTEFRAYKGDIEELGRQGLLNLTYQKNSLKFDIAPFGFRYYEHLRERAGEPEQRVIAHLQHHIDSESFRQRCPEAHAKWRAAESLLWGADSQQQLTAIGHHCREALQECVHALVLERNPEATVAEKPRTVARVKALLVEQDYAISDSVKPYLEALVAYWGTVSDLVQRQEHAGAKEGEPLLWNDARRVVAGTLLVMSELTQVLRPPK